MNLKPDISCVYVDSDAAMKSLIVRMKSAKRIAVDIEADSLHHYFHKVCLIQLSFGGDNYIVDSLANIDISAFLNSLAKKPLIFHDGNYDLRMLRATFDFQHKNTVFDTMLAGQLLGIEQISLLALASDLLGIGLSKKGQKSDWSRRPLTKEQLKYAVDDTLYLEPIADKMHGQLETFGRNKWHEESCEFMIRASADDKEPKTADNAWRIKRAGLLKPCQLVYLRELWHWREDQARKADRPPFKIIGNEQLLALSIWAEKNPGSDIKDGPRLPRHCTGRRLRALKKAIDKAAQTPESDWPEKRRARRVNESLPDSKVLMDTLKVECSRLASELGINTSVLAPARMLKEIVKHRPSNEKEIRACAPIMKWQANLLENIFLETLRNYS